MNEDKKWLDGLRNKMDGFEESVPDGLWENIETSIFPEKKRRSVIALPWLWRGAAAAAVAAGVFAGVRLLDSPVSPAEGQVNVVAVAPESAPSEVMASADEGISTAAAQSENLLAEAEPSSRAVRRNARTMPSVPVVPASENKESSQTALKESSSAELVCEVVENLSTEPQTEEIVAQKGKIESDKDYEYENWERYLSETSSKKSAEGSPVTVDVSFSGATTSSNDVRSFDPMMFYRGSNPAFDHPASPDAGSFTGNNLQTRSMSPAMFTSTPITTDVEHKRPVRVALTAHKSFGKIFGVESGLSYSTLRSTFSTTSGNTLKEEVQTLRYLGVPLNLTASAFSSKRFSVYVSGGGMAEKCVSGKVKTTETVSGVRQDGARSEDLTVKPVLWSLNAAAGAQANLTNNIGLYVEPGVSYHFDDGSSVQTIYKDHPLDFIMTFGARFSFR